MKSFRLGALVCCTSIFNLNLIRRIITGTLLLSLSVSVYSDEQSAYGYDYFKITRHPLLAEIMIELEPKLIVFYKEKNKDDRYIRWGLTGIAKSFRDDEMYKPMLEDLESVSRTTLLKLAGLPKEKYPTLHEVVELVQLNMRYKEKFGVEWTEDEYEKSMRLYKALHGKEYGE